MRFLITPVLALLALVAPAADPAPDQAAIQAAMAKMSTTGAEHAALAKAVGEWDVAASLWMTPGAPPATFTDSATFTMVLDGKWLRQDYRGTRMGPYTGLGMSGFDTVAKTYLASWFDSFMTTTHPLTGTSSDGGKTITYASEVAHCPTTGGPLSFRYVHAWESPDRMVFTMFTKAPGGAEQKGMELVYTRKQAAK
jgi:hypothetical protein